MAKETISNFCSVEGCESKRWCRGYCVIHYSRWKRYGTTDRITNWQLGEGDTEEARFWSRVAITANPDKCWEWQAFRGPKGYGQVYVNGKHCRSSRAAWYYTYGKFPELFLLHSCDNPPCCNPKHLREGTPKDNADDRNSRNRHTHGASHALAKLTDTDVLAIRRDFNPRVVTIRALARKYGVKGGTITSILSRRTWKHI
jgi:hypothetical protein